jgi:hypothetical protein
MSNKTRADVAMDIRQWKDMLANPNTIPVNNNYEYKKVNDVYERMHVYLKSWVEGMFGWKSNKDGFLQRTAVDEDTEAAKEWMESSRPLTDLPMDWLKTAMAGGKKAKAELPHIDTKGMTKEVFTKTAKGLQSDVVDHFFPAYRALRDSFDKRSFWQWFSPSKHRQYVAERDALKAMTNLITSMTSMTKDELNAKYEGYKGFYPEYEIYPEKVEKPVIKAAEYKPVEKEAFDRLRVFQIGYRPNNATLSYEKKALGDAQKMIMKGLIKDEAIKKVINENIRRWKEVSDLSKISVHANKKLEEAKLELADLKLKKDFPNYKAEDAMKLVDDALVQYAEAKKKPEPMKVDLGEPKADVVPPVEQKPVEIAPPNTIK